MSLPEPKNGQIRVIILGLGFGGLKLAKELAKNPSFQLLLIDRNNYHQFQPLLYQVATAGLEPSSISFPLRKIFRNSTNIFIRVAEVSSIDPNNKVVVTTAGDFKYNKLVIALGSTTNYFGNQELEENCIGLKSVSEALYIRNKMLSNYEAAIIEKKNEVQPPLNIAIVGGGPTGVELAGAIAEMRSHILPKEYPELDFSEMNIYLIEAGDRLLNSMSLFSSQKSKKYLEHLGVKVFLNTFVKSYDGETVTSNQGDFRSFCTIWAAGVRSSKITGIPESLLTRDNRIMVDEFNRLKSVEAIYAIGDIALMQTESKPHGDPQVAPTAIQQAQNLAKNLKNELKGKALVPFRYIDKGSMATVGKNLAVVEILRMKFGGIFAWLTWMFVHLMSILGIKNRFFILINWVSNYFTHNLSLRLILKAAKRDEPL